MSYKGSITHEQYRKAAFSGFVPDIRVHLQEILPGGRGGPMMRLLSNYVQVNWNREIGGMGRASIVLHNPDDRFFRKQYKRSFSPQSSETTTRQYLKDMLGKSMPYVREVNPDRYPGSTNFQALRSFVTDSDISNYVDFLFNFDAWNQGEPSGKTSDLVDLGLMQRITIEQEGQDGLWYPQFTGIVTGIEDILQRGESPTITVHCADYWRLLKLSEIFLRAGPGIEFIANSIDLRLQQAGLVNAVSPSLSLAGLNGIEILHLVLDIVNQSLCFIPFVFHQRGLTGYSYDDEALRAQSITPDLLGLDTSDYFAQEGFWYIPFADRGKVVADYLGLPALRRRATQIHDYGNADVLSPIAPKVVVPDQTPGRKSADTFPVAEMYSTLRADRNILSGTQGQAYQLLVERILAPYQSQRSPGDAIVKKVADATFFDVFFNGNGDLVYQIPKYNNFPGEYAPTFRSRQMMVAPQGRTDELLALTGLSGIASAAQAVEIPFTDSADYDFKKVGIYDYAPAPDNFAMRYHGFNHVLTDLGHRGWRLASTEELLVTDVRVPAGSNIVQIGEIVTALAYTGRTKLDDADIRQLQGRFGHRAVEVQQIIIPDLYSTDNATALLDAFAKGMLQQLNAKASSGTFVQSSRPDLDVGATALILERQRLYYMIGISGNYKVGGDVTTTFNLAFGHDIGTQIPSPWVTVREQLKTIADRPKLTPAQVASQDAAAAQPTVAVVQASYDGNNELIGFKDVKAAVDGLTSPSTLATKGTSLAPSDPAKDVKTAVDVLVSRGLTASLANGVKLSAAEQANFGNIYTLARVISSEAGTLSLFSQLVHAFVIAADGSNIEGLVIKKGVYGRQGSNGRGRASTSQDPTFRHVVIAQYILSGRVRNPVPAGSYFFSPKSQQALIRRGVIDPSRTPSFMVNKFYKLGCGWLKIVGDVPDNSMVFVPRSKKITQSKEAALAVASKYDA